MCSSILLLRMRALFEHPLSSAGAQGDVPSLFGLPEHATKVRVPTGGSERVARPIFGFLDWTPIDTIDPIDFWRKKNTKSIQVTKKACDYRCSTSQEAEASLPFYSEPYRFFNLDVFEWPPLRECGALSPCPWLQKARPPFTFFLCDRHWDFKVFSVVVTLCYLIFLFV